MFEKALTAATLRVFTGTVGYLSDGQRGARMLATALDLVGEPSISPKNPEDLIRGIENLAPEVRMFNANPNQTNSIFEGLINPNTGRQFYEGI